MLTPAEMLTIAIRIASKAHLGQFDKAGEPYILHPLKVMYKLKTTDHELMAIAVLHDVLEDTTVSEEDLVDCGFSSRVIEGIKSVTKIQGESYDDYKKRVFVNRDGMLVKKEDLRHNSDLRRLKGTTEKDIKRVERYMKFYDEICEKLGD